MSTQADSSTKETQNSDAPTPKNSSTIKRASSQGGQPQNFTQAQAEPNQPVGSPRYKYDVETNKYVVVKDRSPMRGSMKTVVRLNPA